MAVKRVAVIVGLVTIIVSAAWGQNQGCVIPRRDEVNPHVRAKVIRSASDFDYTYLLSNRAPARQRIVKFAVQAFGSGQEPQQVSPSDWDAGGRIASSPYHVWDAFAEVAKLWAGANASGFGFARAELPAISTFLAWGEIEYPHFPGGAPETCENSDLIQNSFRGATVGPRPPAQPFVPIEFLNYLITLVHDSRKSGWINVDGVHRSLLAKLINAKRQLERRQTIAARNMLNAFLQEVQAASCPEFTCPGNKPLTSEAYALLFFNGQFLFERLR